TDIGKAAQVQAGTEGREKQRIAQRNKRRALPAEGHIGSAEVADHRDTCRRKNGRAVAYLRCKSSLGLVKYRMTVRCDKPGFKSVFLQETVHAGTDIRAVKLVGFRIRGNRLQVKFREALMPGVGVGNGLCGADVECPGVAAAG